MGDKSYGDAPAATMRVGKVEAPCVAPAGLLKMAPNNRKTRIYPIFLPQWGCPFQCVYCNQLVVTASGLEMKSKEEAGAYFNERVARLAEDSRRTDMPGELSFYGGTFTALPKAILRGLLDASSCWVERGVFTGIRFSTRPDCITPEVCAVLSEYPIRTVELGVQSLSDTVLRESRRGYTSETVLKAAHLVRQHGWDLGIQLMLGLPGDTRERFLDSISGTINMRPDFVRIYPTLVLEGTLLAEWNSLGLYKPLRLDEAIAWCVPAYSALLEADIPVARMGLHADPELEKPGKVIAGPYHPAFGYLVRVYWWRERVDAFLQTRERDQCSSRATLLVPNRYVSEVAGPGRSNICYWRERWKLDRLEVKGDPDLAGTQMEFKRQRLD
ncbi:MAG: elongator complex protein 3 [Syntrophobacteraceae bacterium]